MEVNPLAALSSPPTDTLPQTTGFGENFDNFLSILVAQLRNQDPLEPLDANQFTEQLVQFSAVEQAIKTNTRLDELVDIQQASQTVSALGYLGTTVEAGGATATLRNGQAELTYTLADPATVTAISILDEQGNVVTTLAGETSAGRHSFVWDGKDAQGVTQPDGKYTIRVIAQDIDGDPIDVGTTFVGVVSGLRNEDGQIILSVDDVDVPLDKIISVKQAAAA